MKHSILRRKYSLALIAAALMLAFVTLLGSCETSQDLARRRAIRARQARGDIAIGAAWPWSIQADGMYWEGMKLAVDEINGSGGVLGRPIRIIKADDRESVNQGRLIAQRFAENLNMVAVIGHLNSHVSIPAASIYESAGLLMLTPGSTNPELTQKGFRYVFRSINNDVNIARRLVKHAQSRSYRRVVICYVRNKYGQGLANAFEQEAVTRGIEIVDRQSYGPGSNSFERILDGWQDLSFDAIFLAGMAPEAGYFVIQARKMGITVPIFGGEALDTATLIEVAGKAAEGMVVVSVFHPDHPRPQVQRFNAAFKQRYGVLPDSWAARGYEAVRLLTHAMELAQSTVPAEIAEALRTMEPWPGLTSAFSFNEQGDVINKTMVTVVVRNGRFEFLEVQ